MLIVTFDEAEHDAEALLRRDEPGPNTANTAPASPAPAAGGSARCMLSPCIRPGTVDARPPTTTTRMLRWVEDNFGLAHLAYAAPAARRLVRAGRPQPAGLLAGGGSRGPPPQGPAGRRTEFRFRLFADLPLCREQTTIRFAGRTLVTDANGEAVVRLRLRGRGRRVAAAVPEICDPATATVWVKRRPRSRARVGIGGAAPVG